MDKATRAMFALVLGTCLGWLLLLETGWVHTAGSAGVALVVSVTTLAAVLVWHSLEWLEQRGGK